MYHGCGLANENGTRKLIIHGEKCLFATPKPFWKNTEDAESKVQTRTMEYNKKQRVKDILKTILGIFTNNESIDKLKSINFCIVLHNIFKV